MPTAPRTAQRAYALRLASRPGADLSNLWQTHRAVNAGAQAFGSWLLTFRGGLDHHLVDAPIQERRGHRPPTDAERRSRRVLLALSWLSVETRVGAPPQYVVASTTEPAGTQWQTAGALVEILLKRGLPEAEITVWVADCTPSLTAAIKDGAVWVNRSTAFDDAVARLGASLTRDEVWDLLEPLLGKPEAYLATTNSAEEGNEVDEG
jgi:hypothetical protein